LGGIILKDNNITGKEVIKQADNELYKYKEKWHKKEAYENKI